MSMKFDMMTTSFCISSNTYPRCSVMIRTGPSATTSTGSLLYPPNRKAGAISLGASMGSIITGLPDESVISPCTFPSRIIISPE